MNTEHYSAIGLNDVHWAVINQDYDFLETALSSKDKQVGAKTIDMLFSTHKQKDSRIFIAGDFFFPPTKVEDFPLDLNFDKGTKAVHIAAAMGDVKAIELFIQYKSNINIKDGVGATPLHLACRYGHLDAAKLLLTPKTKIDAGTKTKKSLVFYDAESTVLHAALQSGNTDLAIFLIDNGADISTTTKFGCGAYLFAAKSGKPEVIQLLLDYQLSIPLEGSYGNFPLLEAVKMNSYDSVELLLKNGSPVREGVRHEAPLNKAVENNYLDIRSLLIEYGAKPLDYKGDICSAARNNDTTFIKAYHNDGGDINKVFDGRTALMAASAQGYMATVELLLSLGADVNVHPGDNALFWALANDHYQIAQLLLNHNIDCSLVNEYGNNPLFYMGRANIPNRIKMCTQMIELGANPHSKAKHGGSAYAIAKDRSDLELLDLYNKTAVGEAVDMSYKVATQSKVLQSLSADYNWKTVYNELWDELVPPSGEAHSVQGELLRSIGKLSDEFFRNGNINWGHNKVSYLEMISFMREKLLDGSIDIDENEIKSALTKLTHFNIVHYEKADSPHYKVCEAVVKWCAAHKDLIELVS